MPKYNTWKDFYHDKHLEGGTFRELFDSSVTTFNKTSLDHLNDSKTLKVTVASSRFTFILLPGQDKKVNLLHSAILVPTGTFEEPVIIGIQGSRSTSPFQVIPLDPITRAIRTGRTSKTSEKWTAPSLDQFLALTSETEFEELKAERGTEITEDMDFSRIPCHLFIHPFIFSLLDGRGTVPANSAGFKVVERLQRLQESPKPEEVEEIGELVQATHLTLSFLWAVSRGLINPIVLENPPEADGVDESCNLVLQRMRGNDEEPQNAKRSKSNSSDDDGPKKKKNKPRRKSSDSRKSSSTNKGRNSSHHSESSNESRNYSDDSKNHSDKSSASSRTSRQGSEKGLTALLVQNMNELAASHLEIRKTEERKSSMMNKMGQETEKFFLVLSAKDWNEKKPKLNEFMRRLMKDKGMSRANELVRSEMRRGEGVVTENGLIQFLSGGYLCKTVDEKPGGFTFFMFRPVHVQGAYNPRLVEQSIRETFGDAKLSDEIVKFYAKGNYFLPTTFPDFMIQLETCFRTLELFTSRRGIASKGYRLAFRLIQEQAVRYRPLFRSDPTLGIKIGRFLDNVFQNFCLDFSDYVFDRDPIRSARRRLEFRFEDQVQSFFNGIRNGVVPSILLPESLTPNSSVTGMTEESGSGATPGKAKQGKGKGKLETNPEVPADCRIPPGKRFGDFFSPGRGDLKPNVVGWPSFPHQVAKVDRPMCLRYQVTGECTANCPNSHILPSAIPAKSWEGIRERLKKIMRGSS
jgi:hypothetical protein